MASPTAILPLHTLELGQKDDYGKLGGVTGWVNSQTAGFCQDYQPLREFHQPRSRVITRFALSVGICFLAVLLLLILLFTQDSEYRTVRYWGAANYAQKLFSPYLSSPNAKLDTSYKEHAGSTLCPCSNTAFSWTSFLEIFTIAYSSSQRLIRSSMVVNGSDFCFKTVTTFPLNTSLISKLGCPNLINAVVSKVDSRTVLTSTSLMDPVLLNETIQRNLQSNLNSALNDCVFLMSNVTSWDVKDPFDWLRDIYEAFEAMVTLFGSDPHASDLEYWNQANDTLTSSSSHVPLMQVIDHKSALGMQVNWTKYVEDCSPIYCDVIKETSVGYKFFSTSAQIGGFGTLILLVIRKVLWPSIRCLFGWEAI